MDGVLTGFHGKLPSAGDFVSRGLPTGFAAFWDRWAAQHLTGREVWPAAGLRLRLVSGGRVACGLVRPGADRVGRRFPLAAFVIAGALPGPRALDPWCDAAARVLDRAQAEPMLPDTLDAALAELAPPEGAAEGALAPALLWTADQAPLACDMATPGAALAAAFSCSGSSSP